MDCIIFFFKNAEATALLISELANLQIRMGDAKHKDFSRVRQTYLEMGAAVASFERLKEDERFKHIGNKLTENEAVTFQNFIKCTKCEIALFVNLKELTETIYCPSCGSLVNGKKPTATENRKKKK